MEGRRVVRDQNPFVLGAVDGRKRLVRCAIDTIIINELEHNSTVRRYPRRPFQ